MTDHRSRTTKDGWIAAAVFASTFLSRIPFRSQILYHWDSVNFAFAMREFDVIKEQPQPPGYIVYVWLCRLVDLLFHDAQTTMVAISIVSSALAVVALFYLGRAMYGRRVGVVAALLLAASPLFWFYGEIALPHTLDAFLVILAAWWLYEVMKGKDALLIPAVIVLTVAGGVRQQTLVFLAPLALFAIRRVGWRRFARVIAVGAVICLLWFLPLVYSSGGPASYVRAMGAFSRRFQDTTSVLLGAGWTGVQRNMRKLGMYTLYGWSVALVPGVIYVASRLRRHQWLQRWEKLAFLLVWMAPSSIFYTIVHMGQQGLVFVFLPALLLVSAVGLTQLATTSPHRLVAGTAILVILNAGIFVMAPEYPLGPGTQRLLTRATLENSDRYYQDRFEAIETKFPPESTAILAANWHHVEYYLPEYKVLRFDKAGEWEKEAGSPGNSLKEDGATPAQLGLQLEDQGQATILVFDPDLRAFAEGASSAHELPLEHGGSLEYFVLTGQQSFHHGIRSFGVAGD